MSRLNSCACLLTASLVCALDSGSWAQGSDKLRSANIEAVREAVLQIHVAQSDRCLALMERARSAVLDALQDASASPFIDPEFVKHWSLDRSQVEADTEDYGQFAGQMWTERLLHLVGVLHTRSNQCVTIVEAEAAAASLHSAAEQVSNSMSGEAAKVAAAVQDGAKRLRNDISLGDLIVARRALIPEGVAKFAEELRIRATELTKPDDSRSRVSSQVVFDAYHLAFQGDPCIEAAGQEWANWTAQNSGLQEELQAFQKSSFGQPEQEFLKNRSARRRTVGAAKLRREMEQRQGIQARMQHDAARFECMLALIGSVCQCSRAEPEASRTSCELECTIVWTPPGSASRWFLATYPVAIERSPTGVQVWIGLPHVTGNEFDLAIDLAGATARIPCSGSESPSIQGLTLRALDPDAIAQSLRAVACVEPRTTTRVRVGALDLFRYPLLEHGFAYGQASLRASALRVPAARDSPQEVVLQSSLLRKSRDLQQEDASSEIHESEVALIGESSGATRCINKALRLVLKAQIAVRGPSEEASGFPAVVSDLVELLAPPENSMIRDRLARWNPRTERSPAISADTARDFLSAVDARSECAPDTPAIVARLIDAMAGAGLDRASAEQVVGRAFRTLRDSGIPAELVSDRWALSAVPLMLQVAGASAITDPSSRAPVLDALEWMLLGVADRQSVGGEERRSAWNAALGPLRAELDVISHVDGDGTATTRLVALQDSVVGGIRWRAGYPCYPILNFDPDPDWVTHCTEIATMRAKGDLERMTPGSSKRWPSGLTTDERRKAIAFLGGRMHEVLATEPQAGTAPHGYGAAQLPGWASAFAIAIQDESGPVVSIQRK